MTEGAKNKPIKDKQLDAGPSQRSCVTIFLACFERISVWTSPIIIGEADGWSQLEQVWC